MIPPEAAKAQGHIVGVQWKFDLKRCQRRPMDVGFQGRFLVK